MVEVFHGRVLYSCIYDYPPTCKKQHSRGDGRDGVPLLPPVHALRAPQALQETGHLSALSGLPPPPARSNGPALGAPAGEGSAGRARPRLLVTGAAAEGLGGVAGLAAGRRTERASRRAGGEMGLGT